MLLQLYNYKFYKPHCSLNGKRYNLQFYCAASNVIIVVYYCAFSYMLELYSISYPFYTLPLIPFSNVLCTVINCSATLVYN